MLIGSVLAPVIHSEIEVGKLLAFNAFTKNQVSSFHFNGCCFLGESPDAIMKIIDALFKCAFIALGLAMREGDQKNGPNCKNITIHHSTFTPKFSPRRRN